MIYSAERISEALGKLPARQAGRHYKVSERRYLKPQQILEVLAAGGEALNPFFNEVEKKTRERVYNLIVKYLPDPKEEIIGDGTFNDFCTRAIEVLGINADRKGPLQFLSMKSDENGRGIPGSGHRTNRELLEEMRDRY